MEKKREMKEYCNIEGTTEGNSADVFSWSLTDMREGKTQKEHQGQQKKRENILMA